MSRPILLASVLLTLIGCGGRQEAGPRIASISSARKPEIPAEGPYTIISDRDESPARREVEVNLKEKVSPENLREIALQVKAREERPHGRTAIWYYLPVEFPELAGQPWAHTHFTPALDLKILGFSQQEEDAMRKLPLDHKGKRIGAWLQDNQYKTLDVIYDEDGVIKIAEILSPTDRSDQPMNELPSPNGRRFRKLQGSNFYDVDYAGNLRILNAEGKVFSAAKPMK